MAVTSALLPSSCLIAAMHSSDFFRITVKHHHFATFGCNNLCCFKSGTTACPGYKVCFTFQRTDALRCPTFWLQIYFYYSFKSNSLVYKSFSIDFTLIIRSIIFNYYLVFITIIYLIQVKFYICQFFRNIP